MKDNRNLRRRSMHNRCHWRFKFMNLEKMFSLPGSYFDRGVIKCPGLCKNTQSSKMTLLIHRYFYLGYSALHRISFIVKITAALAKVRR